MHSCQYKSALFYDLWQKLLSVQVLNLETGLQAVEQKEPQGIEPCSDTEPASTFPSMGRAPARMAEALSTAGRRVPLQAGYLPRPEQTPTHYVEFC